MTKADILDYSTIPAENQDINNISTLGTAKPNVIDDIVRAQMSHIAKGAVTRRSAKDTAYTVTKADYNQLIAFTAVATCTTQSAATLTSGWECYIYAEGGAVTINPNGSETVNGEEFIIVSDGTLGVLRVYDGNFLFSAFGAGTGQPKVTIYDTDGNHTHTFDARSTHFSIEGCGAGAAGAASNTGSFTTTNYASGGHSGWWYTTDPIARNAIASASLTVGAGGTSTPGSPVNGGDTSYDDGTNTFTWPGGKTPISLTGTDATARIFQYEQSAAPSDPRARFGQAGFGTQNITFGGTGGVLGGKGGDTPYGEGGQPVSSINSNGNPGSGNGSGGSGSVKSSGTPGFNGGAGRPGIIIIREWTE